MTTRSPARLGRHLAASVLAWHGVTTVAAELPSGLDAAGQLQVLAPAQQPGSGWLRVSGCSTSLGSRTSARQQEGTGSSPPND